ncbi:MAG: chromosomal replication initiator DnaA [Alphaproteobacteria bacterium]|nr:chromosomal replication initiator DnaA [Alphaproteobacteria bacterium]
MARQLRLRLGRPASQSRETFVAGPSNAQAMAALGAWPAWPGGCLVLVGPEGVGKSHLARAWAEDVGARILDRRDLEVREADQRPWILEDVDRSVSEEALFHLINLAPLGGGLLLTARAQPIAWPAALPDLRSRLNALYVAEIEEPDDQVLSGVLEKFFQERNIRPSPDLYPYLLRRMERSAVSAREIVERLDEAPDELKPVSRVLARQLLERD